MPVASSLDAGATRPNAKLGMTLFLVADAISFAALLIACGWLRAHDASWPARGSRLAIPFTAGMTLVLACSSATMLLAAAAARRHRRRALVAWLAATMLAGVLFLAGQAHEWTALVRDKGMRPGADQMSSTFFVCTGFHGAHVLAGVVLLGLVALGAARGRYDGDGGGVEVAALFWHFVDVVWILVFTFVYLV